MNGCKRLRKSGQAGFTMIELVAVVAIMAVIGGSLTTTIYQMYTAADLGANRMAAVKEVESAVHWVSRDVQMAQTLTVAQYGGMPFTIGWVEWDNTDHQIAYAIENGELVRRYSIDGGAAVRQIAARHILADNVSTHCQFSGGEFTLTVTASLGGFRPSVETRTCKVSPRPTG
jgi:prepilin-type N-terminal cleavage/methylation domain-containing protein